MKSRKNKSIGDLTSPPRAKLAPMTAACRDADFQPADLLLFAGRGRVSRTIALWSCSLEQLLIGEWFSHIAFIARHGVAGGGGRPLLFESTTLCDLPCEIQGKRVKGVQAHDPRARIAAYDGGVWRLRLVHAIDEGQSEILARFALKAIGEGYDYEGAALAGTRWLKFARWLRPDPKHLFCSRFAMDALKSIDVVDHDLNPAIYSPAKMAADLQWWGTYFWINEANNESVRLK